MRFGYVMDVYLPKAKDNKMVSGRLGWAPRLLRAATRARRFSSSLPSRGRTAAGSVAAAAGEMRGETEQGGDGCGVCGCVTRVQEHRGFGFVTFETEAAIQRVVSHGAHRLKGSTIAIDIAMPKVRALAAHGSGLARALSCGARRIVGAPRQRRGLQEGRAEGFDGQGWGRPVSAPAESLPASRPARGRCVACGLVARGFACGRWRRRRAWGWSRATSRGRARARTAATCTTPWPACSASERQEGEREGAAAAAAAAAAERSCRLGHQRLRAPTAAALLEVGARQCRLWQALVAGDEGGRGDLWLCLLS